MDEGSGGAGGVGGGLKDRRGVSQGRGPGPGKGRAGMVGVEPYGAGTRSRGWQGGKGPFGV